MFLYSSLPQVLTVSLIHCSEEEKTGFSDNKVSTTCWGNVLAADLRTLDLYFPIVKVFCNHFGLYLVL